MSDAAVCPPWVTNELGHVRLADPPAGLPAPATAHHTGVAWWMARVGVLEFQRQMDITTLAEQATEIAGLRALLVAAGRALDETTAAHARRPIPARREAAPAAPTATPSSFEEFA